MLALIPIGTLLSLLAWLCGAALWVGDGEQLFTCPVLPGVDPSASSCSCSAAGSCEQNVDNVDAASIKKIFDQPFAVNVIPKIEIRSLSDRNLPANLFGDKLIKTIVVACANSSTRLDVSESAFAGTADHTRFLTISRCDLSSNDGRFLGPMNQLVELNLDDVDMKRFDQFVARRTLTHLTLKRTNVGASSIGFDAKLFRLTPNLQVLTIFSYQVDALESLPPLAQLTWFKCYACHLPTFPVALQQVDSLQSIYLDFNPISVLRNGSVRVSSSPTVLSFMGCPLVTIEPAAFQGWQAVAAKQIQH